MRILYRFCSRDDSRNNSSEDLPGWYMEMQDLGYNYRITDFQAALGSSQLKRADKGLDEKEGNCKKIF